MEWPEVGIYTGFGASHSWTWFADIFERSGFYAVSFLDETDITAGALDTINVLLISGGDTFAIADGLGRLGAEKLSAFIAAGGVYIGSCAGAYLPLKSSIPPLNLFNFVSSRIINLTKHLPEAKQMAEKFCTEYGCQYVFHPVRDEVRVKVVDKFSCSGKEIRVPLYGGPSMTASDEIEILATYTGFTEKTEFLVDEALAGATLLGNVAAARKYFGKGVLYLFGPHFEHPYYPDANAVLFEVMAQTAMVPLRETMLYPLNYDRGQTAVKNLFRAFKREISNSRIVALALERMPYQWQIGRKVYDPEKIRVFIEAVWSRINMFEDADAVHYISEQEMEHLFGQSRKITALLRQLKQNTDAFAQEAELPAELFTNLRKLTAAFLSKYFRLKQLHHNAIEKQKGFSACSVAH